MSNADDQRHEPIGTINRAVPLPGLRPARQRLRLPNASLPPGQVWDNKGPSRSWKGPKGERIRKPCRGWRWRWECLP